MTLNVNLLLYCPCYAYSDQTAEAKIVQFQLNVAQDLTSVLAKFGCYIRSGSLNWELKLGWGGF